jgi:hypothetical protein
LVEQLRQEKAATLPLSTKLRGLEARLAKAKKAKDQAKAKAVEATEKAEEAIQAKADAEAELEAQEARVAKLDQELKEAREKAEAPGQGRQPSLGTDILANLIPDAAKKLESPEAKQALAALEDILSLAKDAFEKLGSFLPKEGAKQEAAEEDEGRIGEGDSTEPSSTDKTPPTGQSQTGMECDSDNLTFDLEAWITETGLDEEAADKARANPPKRARTSPYSR